MARPRSTAAVVAAGTPDDIEAQFYQALQRGDIDRLMAVWADDDEVVCVHPGGGRLVGPAAIRESFEAIFASGGGSRAGHRATGGGSADDPRRRGVPAGCAIRSTIHVQHGLDCRYPL